MFWPSFVNRFLPVKLAGCPSMPFSDIGERHDEYIGASLRSQPDERGLDCSSTLRRDNG